MPNKPIVASNSPVWSRRRSTNCRKCNFGGFCLVDAFVGVDGGADHLLAAGVTPAAVIGDLDSLSDLARATFAEQTYHIAEQETTDFEKALTRIDAARVLAVGFYRRADGSRAIGAERAGAATGRAVLVA